MSFILLGILNSQVSGAAGGSYELIESNILTSSASSVTFSSIPQDYKHLQIRMAIRGARSSTFDSMRLRFNGVSTSTYGAHRLEGNGSSVSSGWTGSSTYINVADLIVANNASASIFSGASLDLLDYASTSKTTTTRTLIGDTSKPVIFFNSGLWTQTNAVTQIQFFTGDASGFVAGSRFSLYGIRG